jgi:hypothetical protein
MAGRAAGCLANRQGLVNPGAIVSEPAKLQYLRFRHLHFGESDACLVVVAVFKTADPALCAGW